MRLRHSAPRGVGDPGARRWRARPFLAVVVRGAVLVVPIAAGTATGLLLARALPRPEGFETLAWATGSLVASTAVVMGVDRLARRLLPLAVLLKLALVFPDRAPSRYRLARVAGNTRVLAERVRRAREHGLEDDPAKAAETILALVAALSAHDRKTRGHSERVRVFTDLLADELSIAEADRDRLRWAALLHDVGKLEVPGETLNKPGKPDEEEWERIRCHPLEGERIARPLLPWLGDWGACIGQHHERYDGGGYPRGLRGKEIALAARIVALADAFEVMTAARSYKRPMSVGAARTELARCAGSQFDPRLVRAFFGISLGRLWWAVGPASWVAQVPFLLGVGRTADRAVTLVRAASGLAIKGLTAVLALGVGVAAGDGRLAGMRSDGSHGSGAAAGTTVSVSTLVGTPMGADPSVVGATPPTSSGTSEASIGPNEGAPAEGPASSSDPDAVAIEDLTDATEGTIEEVVEVVEDTVDEVVEEIEETVDDTVDDVVDGVDGGLPGGLG